LTLKLICFKTSYLSLQWKTNSCSITRKSSW